MNDDIKLINEKVQAKSSFITKMFSEMNKVIVGQREMLERLIIAILADGHVLLEGLPGLAKTLSVKTLAEAIGLDFKRIQFTPDLLPADLIGTLIYNPKESSFSVKKGPLFANIVLADEINRAPSKVQSALLEAMQERQVTIGDESHILPKPFLVLATQNPVEQSGTYQLPEAQVDRFMIKIKVDYPSKEEELVILDMMSKKDLPKISPVVNAAEIMEVRDLIDTIYIDQKIKDYILDIVFATRNPDDYGIEGLSTLILYGASPRATIALTRVARVYAFVQGRGYVIPDDVKQIALDVLRHRIILSYEAEAEELKPEDVITRIFAAIPSP